jgi:hypothetical protein
MTGWLAAAANNAGDAAGTQIPKTGYLGEQLGTLPFEVGNGLWHE